MGSGWRFFGLWICQEGCDNSINSQIKQNNKAPVWSSWKPSQRWQRQSERTPAPQEKFHWTDFHRPKKGIFQKLVIGEGKSIAPEKKLEFCRISKPQNWRSSRSQRRSFLLYKFFQCTSLTFEPSTLSTPGSLWSPQVRCWLCWGISK